MTSSSIMVLLVDTRNNVTAAPASLLYILEIFPDSSMSTA